MSRRGPVSLADRLNQKAAKSEPIAMVDTIQPLWGMPQLMKFLDKKRASADAFLKNNPDFPGVKIGGEWRFDEREVRAWVARKCMRVAQ